MPNYPDDLDFQSADLLVRNDVRLLSEMCGSPPRRLKASEPDRSYFQVLISMLRSEESLSRGEIIARISRMPRNWENALNEALLGSAPFHTSEYDLGLKITMANIGMNPISAVVSVRKNYGINSETGEYILSLYDIEKIREEIQPGQAITLPVRDAIRLVRTWSYMAVKPGIAQTASVSRARMSLREIAYHAEYSDPASPNRWDKTVIDSASWQADEARSSYEVAQQLLKNGDQIRAAEVIAGVKAWWPKPEGWKKLEAKLRKAA